jgi:coenzyme F420-dependent glucose-6-phosphate dehydrogenase
LGSRPTDSCTSAGQRAKRKRPAPRWSGGPTAPSAASHFLELPLPSHFEEATELVREEDIAKNIVCGPDPERHIVAIREYVEAGYDHVYVHQVGPDQEGFFDFYERAVLPEFSMSPAA